MKPIFITEEQKEQLVREFAEHVKSSMFNGEYSFCKAYTYDDKTKRKAKIIYTADAYVKTLSLLAKFDTEVAWHILVRRGDAENEFIVYDVLVYPQKVTGSTVNTNDDEYTQFMIDLTDNEADNLRGQCHSHVNMAVSPSGVDTAHQEKLLQMLNDQGFYLFQIWNKKLDVNSYLYDYDNNIMYEPKDVDIDIMDQNEFLMTDFINEAKDEVKQVYTYTYPAATKTGYSDNYTNYYGKQFAPKDEKKSFKKKKKSNLHYENGWSGWDDLDDDVDIIDSWADYADYYYGYQGG